MQDPNVSAVCFTGSAGGRALFDLATGRPDPIPFYGELGSANPAVVTAAAARHRAEEIASGLVASVGATAVRRFLRPGVLPGLPNELLPPALRDANPINLPRRLNGVITSDPVR